MSVRTTGESFMRPSPGTRTVVAFGILTVLAFCPENREIQAPARIVADDKPTSLETHKTKVASVAQAATSVQANALGRLSSDTNRNPKIEEMLEARADFTIGRQPLKEAIELIAKT